MSSTTAPSERYYQRMTHLKQLGGPGYGGKPEPERDPEDDFSLKKFFHWLYCVLKQKVTGEKCKREEKDEHGTR